MCARDISCILRNSCQSTTNIRCKWIHNVTYTYLPHIVYGCMSIGMFWLWFESDILVHCNCLKVAVFKTKSNKTNGKYIHTQAKEIVRMDVWKMILWSQNASTHFASECVCAGMDFLKSLSAFNPISRLCFANGELFCSFDSPPLLLLWPARFVPFINEHICLGLNQKWANLAILNIKNYWQIFFEDDQRIVKMTKY